MSRPALLFLTDLTNGAEKEDILISNFLKRDFDVTICHPRDCEEFENKADAIIIRNIWNDNDYGKPEPWYRRWRDKPYLPIHDNLYIREGDYYSGSGESKDYLVWLYKNKFPVIPSVDSVTQLEQLPKTDSYFIKPQDGFSGIGARKVSKAELLALNPKHFLIQPFVDFEYEISFYYLDKKLQYVLYAPDKTKRWNMAEFVPSEEDVAFAEKFIQWNLQKYGIERIDACRLKTGELLLTEITDQGGAYLSLLMLSDAARERFYKNFSASIRKNCLKSA